MTSRVDICVPLFNEEMNIELLLTNYIQAKLHSPNIGNLILVDNGSTDRTWEIISSVNHDSIQVQHIDQNTGYGGGASLAIQNSKSKFVALIPANNQYPFVEVTKIIDIFCSMRLETPKKLLVKGRRVGRKDPIGIQILSFIYTILMSVSIGKYFSDINGMPKVFERDLIARKVQSFPMNAAFDASLLLEAKRLGFKFEEFPITYLPRLNGEPSWANNRIRISFRMLRAILQYRFQR
jgi:glycosyltransferase involved in cell wall biosynthesis